MSVIESSSQTSAATAISVRTSSAFNQKAVWLRELERAQWERRVRYQPGDGGEAESAASDGELAGDDGQAMLALARPAFPVADRPVRQLAGKSPSEESIAGAEYLAGREDSSVCGTENGTASVGVVLPRVEGSDGGPEFPAAPSCRSRTAEAVTTKLPMASGEWQELTVHVVEREDEVRIWLRDARLDSHRGLDVLTKVVAQLRGLGNKRVCLNVNGREIARVGQF